jgi:HD superfamily phosphohydrolase
MSMASDPESRKEAQGEVQAELLPVEGPPVAPDDVLVVPAGAEEDPAEESEETLLPVSGMVRLSRRELDVISHPAFQRLFEIFQLGQTNLVYRGATHMRGEHAIGTLKAAMLFVDAIHRNRAKGAAVPDERRWNRTRELSSEETAFVRLGALLHDIGHLPAGHTLEDELGLLDPHDGAARIALILDRVEWHGRRYASLRSLIDREYAAEAAAAAQLGGGGRTLSASELVILLIASDHTGAKAGTSFRVGVCRDIIGNTICADLIDYLHRDWLHLGKPREFDPRLLEYMLILARRKDGRPEERLVVDLGVKERPRPDAVTAILDLLESRYQLAEIALFHRVKLAATGMLERAIAEYRDSFSDADERDAALEELVPELLECSDVQVHKLLERKLMDRTINGSLSGEAARRVEGAVDLVRRLRVRELHRGLHVVFWDDFPDPAQARQVAELYSGGEDPTHVREAAANRLATVRLLEYELELPPCSIVMYCPPLEMNTKIAEVGIYRRGEVDTLARLDEQHNRVSGGHLAAQQERFRRLWRVSFAIDRDIRDRLEEAKLLPILREMIDRETLWVPGSVDDGPEDGVRRIAETLTQREGSPFHGHTLQEPAFNREEQSFEHPGGAPSIRSFIGPRPERS